MNVSPQVQPKDCIGCPIRHRAVCSNCDADELAVLDDIKYYRSFSAGQTIMWAGDQMEFVASIVTGVATLTQNMEDGRTQMVGLLLPSDFVGRPGRDAAPYTVAAATEIKMCCFRRKPFEAMLRDTPHVANRLLEMTLDELDAAREWMLVLGRKTAREKISSLLITFARRDLNAGGKAPFGSQVFTLPLTREAMSNYLGLTLETVSRQVSALKRDGVILVESNRQVTVPDMARLVAEAGDYSDH
ncbi:MAG: Crp/Fnr family transcriptional regulator [Sulfitobacter sp.]